MTQRHSSHTEAHIDTEALISHRGTHHINTQATGAIYSYGVLAVKILYLMTNLTQSRRGILYALLSAILPVRLYNQNRIQLAANSYRSALAISHESSIGSFVRNFHIGFDPPAMNIIKNTRPVCNKTPDDRIV